VLHDTSSRRLGFAMEMGEYDFVGEEGDPFKVGGAIGGRAAEEFVLVAAPLAIIPTDESGLAELANR
jgi:hypothetical protein